MHINQQFIRATESTIINSVAGNLNLGPQALELLTLVERFGGGQAPTLRSAVHELEDPDAPEIHAQRPKTGSSSPRAGRRHREGYQRRTA